MNPTLKRTLRQFLPRSLKPHSIWTGPLQHAKIVTSWHDYPAAILGKTERQLLDWFSQNAHAGETWLDIGAHYGYAALALAQCVGATGRVFAFEPMLASAGCIVQTRELNHLTQLMVLPLALGSTTRLSLEYLPVVRGMVDSTLKRNQTSARLWEETLLVISLDELWQTICGGDTRMHGVKIDVQGMELHVLRGMSNLLKAHCPKLVIEVHPGVERDELIRLLHAVGYVGPAIPIEPAPDETMARFYDDKSYAFLPQP